MALGLNDVDVDGIKAFDKRVRENPEAGKRTVKVRSTWKRGIKALVEIGAQESAGAAVTPPTRRFFVTMDGPGALGGVDAAPTAAESLVGAFAGCLISGIATNGALFDIPIDTKELRAAIGPGDSFSETVMAYGFASVMLGRTEAGLPVGHVLFGGRADFRLSYFHGSVRLLRSGGQRRAMPESHRRDWPG